MIVTERTIYGTRETNGLVDGHAYHADNRSRQHPTKPVVDWTERGLKVTRLRLLSDPGYPYWDVSYCHGLLDGHTVTVRLPFSELPKRNMFKHIIDAAVADGINAKAIGVFGAISTLC
ncbi:MAG: hypothetical protein WC284_15545 [Candidimonas sp.]